MIFYSEQNVYEAAKDRFRYLFREFYGKRPIVLNTSGGKDSTAIIHLAKEVMDEFGIEKLPLFFLDQEGEATMTVDAIRDMMNLPWIEPYWVQSYFREWNSSAGEWFNVWGPGEQWCREKEPSGTYTDLDFDVKEDFPKVLNSAMRCLFGDNYVAIGGVRIDESPNRRTGLTTGDVYKGITWGKKIGDTYTFYPIWDWSFKDVWYYIFSNRLPYCKLYNYYFTRRPLKDCRVSSFIHENSIQSLQDLKDFAPDDYARLLRRVKNVNATVQSYTSLTKYITKLPPYFKDWEEYVVYLAVHLTANPKNAQTLIHNYRYYLDRWRKKFGKWQPGLDETETTIGHAAALAVICEDYAITKVSNISMKLASMYHENYERIKEANQAED